MRQVFIKDIDGIGRGFNLLEMQFGLWLVALNEHLHKKDTNPDKIKKITYDRLWLHGTKTIAQAKELHDSLGRTTLDF